MLILTRDEGERLISPYSSTFVRLISEAWADWSTSIYAHQLIHKRLRACAIWNQIISKGQKNIPENGKLRLDKMRGIDGFVIENKVFIRPKYATSKFLSRNYPTQAALNFHDQNQDLFGGVSRLELLYSLDPLETKIDRMTVVQRHLKSIVWHLDLLDEVDSGQQPIPMTPNSPSGSPADRIIKPKILGDDHAAGSSKRSNGTGV